LARRSFGSGRGENDAGAAGWEQGRNRAMKSNEKSFSTQEAGAHTAKKAAQEEYDLVILGGGTGSTIAAWTFASEGKRVAAIARKYIGGALPDNPRHPSQKNIY